MPDTFNLPSLKSIDQTLADDTIALVQSRLNEYIPSIDFSKQAAFTLAPYLHGLLLAGTTQELLNDLTNTTLAAVQKGTASDAQADQVAGRFGIVRKPAVQSDISVLIVLSSPVPFGLSTTDSFSFGDVKFSVAQSVSVRTSLSSVTSVNDYVLTQIGTGRWGVVVPMVAKTAGAAGNLAPGTSLVASKVITSLSKVPVLASVGNGQEEESTTDMTNRILASQSIESWAGRTSFEAIARRDTTYDSLVAISVVGYGDPEQRRDKRGVLPVAHGGRTDLWVKFRPGLHSAQVPVTAVLVAKTGTTGTWSFTLNGATYPGVYQVDLITAVDDQAGTTFQPISTVASLGVPAVVAIPRGSVTRYVPDVRSATEAAYSAYANITTLFDDTKYDVTSLLVGVTRDYLVNLYYEPLTESLQQKLGSLAVSNPAGDVLVRTAVPCEIGVTVTLSVYQGKSPPTAGSIQQAIVQFINSSGFTGTLSSADISAAVNTSIMGAGTLTVDAIIGQLKKPDGSYLSISAVNGAIVIPTLTEEMVTANTVAFYTDLTKVGVVIQ